jgi:integrase
VPRAAAEPLLPLRPPARRSPDAAAEYLRYAEQDRGCKPSTIRGYRNTIKIHLLPAFGEMAVEDIAARDIERWRAGMSSVRSTRELSNKSKNNHLVLMHAIFRRAVKLYDLPGNPVADRFRVRSSGDIQVFSPEEIWALVRAAGSETDAAIFLTAAFTGLRRGELLALRWHDVDFAGSTIGVRASYAAGYVTTPKSGKVHSVPMVPDVAAALARLGRREQFTGDDDFVFAGQAGLPLDGDALSKRYDDSLQRVGLRRLRFHEYAAHLRNARDRRADIRRVQEWMGPRTSRPR